MDAKKFWDEAKSIVNENSFERCALELFQYQSKSVPVYKKYIELLKVDISSVTKISEIPFLPVQLFKTHVVTDSNSNPEFYFSSSGTTGQQVSRHYVPDLQIYNDSLMEGFRIFYGDPSQYCFLALLPSYLEREGSSLVYMAEMLIKESKHPESGFYLNNREQLADKLQQLCAGKKKIFLLGVTYALVDLLTEFPNSIEGAVIMETGGMKGKRKEMIRVDLHDTLKALSYVDSIHSEYGMTELLSQAYSQMEGKFFCPPWMNTFIYDLHDPFSKIAAGATGTINIIDLANIHSCAFIATQDLGRKNADGSFEVLGRIDNSELRGCNLMIG